MSDRIAVVVSAELAGVRADRALAVLAGLSRATARELIDSGRATVAGSMISRSTTLEVGAIIEFEAPEPDQPLAPEPVPFRVALETDDLIVVDKPSGLVVHPGAGNAAGTLVNGLIHRFPRLRELGAEHRWGLVHRLDRETSGLVLVAKTAEMHTFLQSELKMRRVSRTYLALVTGRLDSATGTIDAPIGRDALRATKMNVTQDGRPARTHYERMAEWAESSLLQIELETGRTHQIRVHFASIGHSIVGDTVYGGGGRAVGNPGRVWLHAMRLAFPLPDGDSRRVIAPLPADLRRSLRTLGPPLSGELGTLDALSSELP